MVRCGVAGFLRAAVRVWAVAWGALWRQDQWRAAAWAEEHCYGDMDGWVLFDAVGVGFLGVLQCFSECLEQLADVILHRHTKTTKAEACNGLGFLL